MLYDIDRPAVAQHLAHSAFAAYPFIPLRYCLEPAVLSRGKTPDFHSVAVNEHAHVLTASAHFGARKETAGFSALYGTYPSAELLGNYGA